MIPDPDSAQVASRRRVARIGLSLFAVYVLIYGGFLYLSAFQSSLMACHPFGGLTLAIWYGMGLIISPLVLALIYLACLRGDATA